MATILLAVSAFYFFITNGIDFTITYHRRNYGPLWEDIIFSETDFLRNVSPAFGFVSLLILLPTSISLAFHLNWFLAFGIAILLRFTLLRIIVGAYMAIFYRGNPYFSMILSFILGIVTMIIGLVID